MKATAVVWAASSSTSFRPSQTVFPGCLNRACTPESLLSSFPRSLTSNEHFMESEHWRQLVARGPRSRTRSVACPSSRPGLTRFSSPWCSLEYALMTEGHNEILSTVFQRFILTFRPLIKDLKSVAITTLCSSSPVAVLTHDLTYLCFQRQDDAQTPSSRYDRPCLVVPAAFQTKLTSSHRFSSLV